MDVALNTTIKIDNRAVPSRNSRKIQSSNLYKDNAMRSWQVGETISPNSAIVFHIGHNLNQIKTTDKLDLSLALKDKTKSPPIVSVPRSVDRDVNLREIIKYLTGLTQEADYPVVTGHDGRRRFPNSQDTFWLETIGGKRYIRGYGDLLLDKGKLRFGYHYTVELVNEG